MADTTKISTLRFSIGSFTDDDTTQALRHIRFDEVPEMPKNIKQIVEQENMGKVHFADTSDKPLTFEGVQEDALKIKYTFRSNADASEIDFVRAAFASAGCEVDTVDTAASLAASLSSGSFSTTADVLDEGQGAVIGVNGTSWCPTLVSDVTGSGPYVCDCAFDPAITASYLYKSVSISPMVGQVDDESLLTFRLETNITSGINKEMFLNKYCALASLGEITIAPNGKVSFEYGFHVTDIADAVGSITTENFVDSEKTCLMGGDNFEVALCDSSTAGSWSTLTNAGNKINLIEAKINLGISTIPIPGAGDDAVNSCQGFMAKYEPATVTVKALFDKEFWDDIEDSTFQEYYLHFVKKSSSATIPCLGFFFPRVYQFANPVLIAELDNAYMMELSFKCNTAKLDSAQGNDSLSNKPWYIIYNQLA